MAIAAERNAVQTHTKCFKSGLRAIDYAGKEQFRWPNGLPILDYLKSVGPLHRHELNKHSGTASLICVKTSKKMEIATQGSRSSLRN
eukprot:1881632-Amphidinium_carterae.1